MVATYEAIAKHGLRSRGVILAHLAPRIRGVRAVMTNDAIHQAEQRILAVVVGAWMYHPVICPTGEDTATALTSAGTLLPPWDLETL